MKTEQMIIEGEQLSLGETKRDRPPGAEPIDKVQSGLYLAISVIILSTAIFVAFNLFGAGL